MKKTPNNLILIEDDGKKKTSEILADLKALFPVWSYYSDEQLDQDFPQTKSSRYFLKVQEADFKLKNKSAEQLQKENIPCITLREMLIFELLYFKKTGKHLDVDNITLCAGSRDQDGDVPSVDWSVDYDKLHVDWSYPQNADDNLRSRAQQFSSLESFNLNPSDLESRVKILEEKIERQEKRWNEIFK